MTNAFVLPGILSTFGICAYVTEQCARFGAKIHHVAGYLLHITFTSRL
jgi:hypothetical protein